MTIRYLTRWAEGKTTMRISLIIYEMEMDTGPDGAVAMSSTNGLVGTGFASQYRLQPRV